MGKHLTYWYYGMLMLKNRAIFCHILMIKKAIRMMALVLVYFLLGFNFSEPNQTFLNGTTDQLSILPHPPKV